MALVLCALSHYHRLDKYEVFGVGSAVVYICEGTTTRSQFGRKGRGVPRAHFYGCMGPTFTQLKIKVSYICPLSAFGERLHRHSLCVCVWYVACWAVA